MICVISSQPVFYESTDPFRVVCRPVVLYREEDWEKEKKVYVDSVMRHMADNAEDGKTKTRALGLLM